MEALPIILGVVAAIVSSVFRIRLERRVGHPIGFGYGCQCGRNE